MRIAICDDEKNIRTYIAALIRRQGIDCEIREYASANGCVTEAGEYDILFLDIELEKKGAEGVASTACKAMENQKAPTAGKGKGVQPANRDLGENSPQATAKAGISGVESVCFSGMAVARQIRKLELVRQPVIIFVTGHEKYIYDAFDVGAFQYLLKPIDEKRFAEVFDRAMGYIVSEAERLDRKLMIQVDGMNKAVPCADICYVESRGHKVILCLKGQTLESWMRIGELEEKLGQPFFRIHKGYLINLASVDGYSRTEVLMSNGDRVPLSKYKYADFVRAYLRFLR